MTRKMDRHLAVGMSLALGAGLLLAEPPAASARSPEGNRRVAVERGRNSGPARVSRDVRRGHDLRSGRGDRGRHRHGRRWSRRHGWYYYQPWGFYPYGYSPWGLSSYSWDHDLDRDGYADAVDQDVDGDGVANFYDRFDFDPWRW